MNKIHFSLSNTVRSCLHLVNSHQCFHSHSAGTVYAELLISIDCLMQLLIYVYSIIIETELFAFKSFFIISSNLIIFCEYLKYYCYLKDKKKLK